MSDCLFCKIVRGEIPAKLVAESELCVAFADIAPPVTFLLIDAPMLYLLLFRRR